jgi:hypothetical protein
VRERERPARVWLPAARTVIERSSGLGWKSLGYGCESARYGRSDRWRCCVTWMRAAPLSTASFSSRAVATRVIVVAARCERTAGAAAAAAADSSRPRPRLSAAGGAGWRAARLRASARSASGPSQPPCYSACPRMSDSLGLHEGTGTRCLQPEDPRGGGCVLHPLALHDARAYARHGARRRACHGP